MKKKILITVGIVAALAVGFGVWYFCPISGRVNQKILNRLEGGYSVPYDEDMDDEEYYDNECFWEMAIFTEADDFFTTKPPVLMIYDAEAGDPGIAGTIINLDEDTIELKIDNLMIDKEYYPSGWQIDTLSNTIEFSYKETEDALELTNHGKTFTFVKYSEN